MFDIPTIYYIKKDTILYGKNHLIFAVFILTMYV